MRTLTLLLTLPSLLHAWGTEGHSLVARIAYDQLTPAAQARVAAILGRDKTLQSIASWADEVRRSRPETASWHFIDIEITYKHLDMTRDCPKDACVVAKIADFRKTLGDPSATADQRREALMFLVHFIGDMHQPLHSSDHRDRGGNDLRVNLNGRDTNLHSVWDTGLLGAMPPEDQLFTALAPDAKRKARKWAKGMPSDWAEEIHKKSVQVTYGKLPKHAEGDVVVLGPEYQKKSELLVQEQIQKAGARLAYVLNAALQ